MTNNKNLIPMNQRTESEQRKIARSGGIASGISRNNKKSIRGLINIILDTSPNKFEILYDTDLPEDTHRALVALSLVKSAENGNLKALEMLLYMTGEQAQKEE